jgi:tRNA(Arg) A34 adenosine deaminase TadA
MHQDYMQTTLALAQRSMEQQGGPFAAIIVKQGRIIAEGYNQVTLKNDPTLHAEIVAIRAACQNEQSFSLQGCILYASCEPCPMCLAAIYWARIDRIYFAATRKEAAAAGFADDFIYEELAKDMSKRRMIMQPLLAEAGSTVLQAWMKKPDKIPY